MSSCELSIILVYVNVQGESVARSKYAGLLGNKDKVLFVDASDQVRVGRAQNYLEPKNVNQIYDWFQRFTDVENYVKVASKADLEENDYNLNIPLYVEKIIEDNLPSVEEALSDLKMAWDESLKAE